MAAQSATPVIPSTSLRQFAKRRRVEVDAAAAAGARSGTGSGSGPVSSVAGVDDEYYALKFSLLPSSLQSQASTGVLHRSAASGSWLLEYPPASSHSSSSSASSSLSSSHAHVFAASEKDRGTTSTIAAPSSTGGTDCLLLWDDATQSYRLEVVSGNVTLGYERGKTALSDRAKKVLGDERPKTNLKEQKPVTSTGAGSSGRDDIAAESMQRREESSSSQALPKPSPQKQRTTLPEEGDSRAGASRRSESVAVPPTPQLTQSAASPARSASPDAASKAALASTPTAAPIAPPTIPAPTAPPAISRTTSSSSASAWKPSSNAAAGGTRITSTLGYEDDEDDSDEDDEDDDDDEEEGGEDNGGDEQGEESRDDDLDDFARLLEEELAGE